jgi:uncharacterized alkaline shock family protein YloU
LVLLYKVETSVGSVSITKTAIGSIVIKSAQNFKDNLKISNQKGKIPKFTKKIGGGDATVNSLDITMSSNGLDIRIYVVMNFGTSIGTVTNELIEEVYNQIEKLTGTAPNSVAVIITGMIAKKQVARRNIEVKR